MNDFADGAQIVVSRSAFFNQLGSAVRTAMIAAGSWLAAKGYIDEGLAQALVPLVLILGAGAWGQLTARRSQAVKVALADKLPDPVAVAK